MKSKADIYSAFQFYQNLYRLVNIDNFEIYFFQKFDLVTSQNFQNVCAYIINFVGPDIAKSGQLIGWQLSLNTVISLAVAMAICCYQGSHLVEIVILSLKPVTTQEHNTYDIIKTYDEPLTCYGESVGLCCVY